MSKGWGLNGGNERGDRRAAGEATLLTPRLRLEPLTHNHAPLLLAALQEAVLYTYIPQEPPTSLSALAERYQFLEARHSPDGREVWLNWAIALRATNEYSGTFEVTVLADQTALLAYLIFAPFQRQGYAQEAGQAVLDALGQTYPVRVVHADIDTRNLASIATIRALGFTQVSVTKDADFFKGSASDEYRFERTQR